MTGIENTAEYIPLGIAVVTGLSGFGIALAQYVWSKRAAPPLPDIKPNTPVTPEYERGMLGRIAEIAGALNEQVLATREQTATMKEQTDILRQLRVDIAIFLGRKSG